MGRERRPAAPSHIPHREFWLRRAWVPLMSESHPRVHNPGTSAAVFKAKSGTRSALTASGAASMYRSRSPARSGRCSGESLWH